MRIDNLKRRLLDSPTIKALVPTLLAAAIGVFSGTLVTEITTAQGLDWRTVHRTFSLYALAILTVAQVIFTRLVYETDRDVLKFAESEYCVAYLRSRCLPEMAARYQELIRSGQGGEFKKAMDEMRDVLK